MSELSTIFTVSASLIGLSFYTSSFFIIKRLGEKVWGRCHSKGVIFEVALRSVTGIHGIITSVVGLLTIQACHDIMKDRYWLLQYYIYLSRPYFIYDLWTMYVTHVSDNPHITCFYDGLSDFLRTRPLMVLHHIIMPALFYPFLFYWRRGLGDYFVGYFLLFELALPFISWRFILVRLRKKESIIYVVAGLSMVLVFGLVRIALFPFLYLKYAKYKGIAVLQVPFHIPLKCNLGCMALISFQIYWFFLMVRGVFRAFLKMSRKKCIANGIH